MTALTSLSIGFVSKVLECYDANAVREHVDNNDYNDDVQSAYRSRHSTDTALVSIHKYLIQSIDCHRRVGLLLRTSATSIVMTFEFPWVAYRGSSLVCHNVT